MVSSLIQYLFQLVILVVVGVVLLHYLLSKNNDKITLLKKIFMSSVSVAGGIIILVILSFFIPNFPIFLDYFRIIDLLYFVGIFFIIFLLLKFYAKFNQKKVLITSIIYASVVTIINIIIGLIFLFYV